MLQTSQLYKAVQQFVPAIITLRTLLCAIVPYIATVIDCVCNFIPGPVCVYNVCLFPVHLIIAYGFWWACTCIPELGQSVYQQLC